MKKERKGGNGSQKVRIFELDLLRGVSILAMCFDHFCFDCTCLNAWFPAAVAKKGAVYALFRFGLWYFETPLRLVGHWTFVTIFLLLAGIGCTLSHAPWKKVARTAVAAAAISAGSLVVALVTEEDLFIAFGILHLMTVAFAIFAFLKKIGNKYCYLAVGVVIVVVGCILRQGGVDESYTLTPEVFGRLVLGTTVYGGDSFGIFPFAGVVLLGAFLGDALYAKRISLFFRRKAAESSESLPASPASPRFGLPSRAARRYGAGWTGGFAPILFVGRHPLLIYLLHQPVIAAVLALLCVLLSGTF